MLHLLRYWNHLELLHTCSLQTHVELLCQLEISMLLFLNSTLVLIMLHSHCVIIVLGDMRYLQAPYSYGPRWMLCFVQPLLTGERWNLLQFDATQCTELSFTALLFKFMSTLYPRAVAFFRDSRAHSSEVRRGSPPRHAVKNSRGTFSHCNPIFPRKGLFREGSFPQQPHYFATPLRRKWSSCSPSWTGDPELQRGGPIHNAVVYKMAPQWRLSSIIYPKYQTAHKGLVDLLVWLKWVKVCLVGLGDVQSVRKRLCTTASLFVGWITYLWNSLHNRTKTKREKNTFVGVLKRIQLTLEGNWTAQTFSPEILFIHLTNVQQKVFFNLS